MHVNQLNPKHSLCEEFSSVEVRPGEQTENETVKPLTPVSASRGDSDREDGHQYHVSRVRFQACHTPPSCLIIPTRFFQVEMSEDEMNIDEGRWECSDAAIG